MIRIVNPSALPGFRKGRAQGDDIDHLLQAWWKRIPKKSQTQFEQDDGCQKADQEGGELLGGVCHGTCRLFQ